MMDVCIVLVNFIGCEALYNRKVPMKSMSCYTYQL